jgi:phosphoribosyl-ATP pyrophosphohydrolase/phosphoribosyl-AMP cyclohydrolase/histidinol dehydrogenase
VDVAIRSQLTDLPTRDIAVQAIAEGACVITPDLDVAIDVCNQLAPEHLEVLTRDPDTIAPRLKHYGGLFLGSHSAEVFGDYGVGPNHVLPTGSTARFKGGLSVFDFLRVRTWLRMNPSPESEEVATDAARLARLEGLEAHARSAERRLQRRSTESA